VGWLRHWWPGLLWAAVIFTFSTHLFTSDNTSRVLIPILRWLLPHAAMATLVEVHHLIRKGAHFTEYFILSLLILRGIRAGRGEMHAWWALWAILIVAAYASLDEFHQVFVPGRTPAVRDVLLDTIGGTVAQIVAALVRSRHGVREHGSVEASP
jgi:VanZ family protein